jgi:hypothetical protein
MTKISKYLLGTILMLFFSFAVIHSSSLHNTPKADFDPREGGGGSGGDINPDCKHGCVAGTGKGCWCYIYFPEYDNYDWDGDGF